MSHAVSLCTMMYHVPCIEMYWCIDTPEWFSMHFGATPIPNILRINQEDHYRHAMLDLLWGKIGKKKTKKKHLPSFPPGSSQIHFAPKRLLFKTEISGSPVVLRFGGAVSCLQTSPFRTILLRKDATSRGNVMVCNSAAAWMEGWRLCEGDVCSVYHVYDM